jgi:hypothetical protein
MENGTSGLVEVLDDDFLSESTQVEGVFRRRGQSGDFGEAMNTQRARAGERNRAEVMQEGTDHEDTGLGAGAPTKSAQRTNVGYSMNGLSLAIGSTEVRGHKVVLGEVKIKFAGLKQRISDGPVGDFGIYEHLVYGGREPEDGIGDDLVGRPVGLDFMPLGTKPPDFFKSARSLHHATEVDKRISILEVDTDAETRDIGVEQGQFPANNDGFGKPGLEVIIEAGRNGLEEATESFEFVQTRLSDKVLGSTRVQGLSQKKFRSHGHQFLSHPRRAMGISPMGDCCVFEVELRSQNFLICSIKVSVETPVDARTPGGA